MRILDLQQGTEEWKKAREGKITGTKLKDIATLSLPLKDDVIKELEKTNIEYKKTWTAGTLMDLLPPVAQMALKEKMPKKLGFYEILAEKIAYRKGDENPMDRGTELEPEARAAVAKYLDEEITEVGICLHDKYDDISVSPDGLIYKNKKPVYAVEIKCLSTARHLQALIEKRIPEEYKFQVLQYFIVIDELEVLFFTFYDPRLVGHELCVIEVHRDEVKAEVEQWFNYQVETLEEINALAEKYSNF